MLYAYLATVHPEPDGFSLWFHDLQGCGTQGDTIAETIDNAQDALGLWLDTALRHGMEIPTASNIDVVRATLEGEEYTTWVSVDLDVYRRSLNEAAVNKTVTLPGWMNEQAIAQGINFSQVLQDALRERLGA